MRLNPVNVPIPDSYMGVDSLPKQREKLINVFKSDDSIVRTPGIDSVISSSGSGCRGADTWFLDEKAYFVQGTTLYRLNADESRTSLGTISGSSDVVFSGGLSELVILVKGGSAYTYDNTNGLRVIDSPNYIPSVSVDFIDGRHVFVPSDGSQAFWTEIDDARTIESTYIFNAEELPDKNVHVVNIKNLLILFGTESAEFFRPTDNVLLPFSRLSGARINTGFVSGGSRYRSAYVFIGRDSQQSYAIFAVEGQSQPVQLSNSAVTEDLNNYSKSEIESARVNRFKWLDKEIVAWTVSDRTYCYVDGKWIFMDSVINGTESGPWRVNGVAFAYGRYYVGDRSTNNIGKLSSAPSEYGESIEYQIDTFLRSSRGSFMTPRGLEVEVLTGQNGGSIGLSLSKDGRIRGDYSYRSLGAAGEYQRRVRWFGGLGQYESFMGISIRGTGQIQFSMEAIGAYL